MVVNLSIPAFPGAEGFGANSVGGRGGRVFEVTNLNDSGLGSLRSAIESTEPRIVVFRVGGTIELNSSLKITNPYITIAGQTAPGGGITLKNSSKNSKAPLKIETHDVVVRHIRSRPGSNPDETGTLDAITIASKHRNVYNVIVDHSSFSWATDEVANIYYDAHDVTIQNSIIAEALDCATHIEEDKLQCHSTGMLIGSEGSRDISIHHNLFAHNRHRNPRIKTAGLVDVVNNVIYNPGFGKGWRSPSFVKGDITTVPVNFVGNFFKPGANTGSADWFIDTKSSVQLYLERNVVPKKVVNPDSLEDVVQDRHPTTAPITTTNAQKAFDQILEYVGASRGLNCDGTFFIRRDNVDKRIVNDVKQGTGHIIDDPSEVGGWPMLAMGTPCSDTDHDGMPDVFEKRFGFDPNDPLDSSQDINGDGYTNIEDYLNGILPASTLPATLSPAHSSSTFHTLIPDEGDLFGQSVAIDQKMMLIGAIGDDDGGTNSGAAYLFQPTVSTDLVFVSFTGSGSVEGISFKDDDILVFDRLTETWSMYFDGSDVALSGTDIDAFDIGADSSILFSVSTATSLPGIGAITDADIVRFIPTSTTGNETAGIFELYFDGSDVGLDTSSENIDAIDVLSDDRIVISTTGPSIFNGVSDAVKDEDLIAFTPTALGETTSGNWGLFFDSSDVGLASSTEDVNGSWIDDSGGIYLTTKGDFETTLELSGQGNDIFGITPNSLDSNIIGTINFLWQGSAYGLDSQVVDGFTLG